MERGKQLDLFYMVLQGWEHVDHLIKQLLKVSSIVFFIYVYEYECKEIKWTYPLNSLQFERTIHQSSSRRIHSDWETECIGPYGCNSSRN